MRQTLVIVPTYNERDNVRPLVEQVLSVAPMADLMLVDDQSPDGTADVAEQVFGRLPNFSVLRRTGARGLGRSYVEAYQVAVAAGYSHIVQMDADLSHQPTSIVDLLRAAEAADVVIGSRYCPGGGVSHWPLTRLALSRCANAYVRAATRLPIRDTTSGYRCYTREALASLPMDQIESTGFAFQVEMTYRAYSAGLRITEIPIIFLNRRSGRSKMTRRVIVEMLLLPWRLRSQAGRLPARQSPEHRRRRVRPMP